VVSFLGSNSGSKINRTLFFDAITNLSSLGLQLAARIPPSILPTLLTLIFYIRKGNGVYSFGGRFNLENFSLFGDQDKAFAFLDISHVDNFVP